MPPVPNKMKTTAAKLTILHLLTLLLLTAGPAFAQGTAFTYNGRLSNDGAPANGPHDMRFTVYDASAAGIAVAGPLPVSPVDVANGLFTVRIDFGANIFTGPTRWLHVEVRPVGGANYTVLTPRQEVTSSPYAIRAQTAGSVASGAVTATQLNTGLAPAPGQFLSYDGGNLVWSDPGVAAGNIWSLLSGNAYYSAGNVGIGTSSPETKLSVFTGGYGIEQTDGTRRISTYLSVTGGWLGTRSPDPLHFFVNSGQSSMTIGTEGNVGIGTASPASGYRLDVVGATRLSPGNGTIQFGSPNAELGLSMLQSSGNRADLRFNGSTLKLLAGSGVGPPSSLNGIAVHTSGNVSIGSLEPPAAKLQVVAQDALSLVGYQPFLTLYDSGAGYAPSRIQGVNGELVLEPSSFVNRSNPNSSVVIANSGNVSVATLTIRGGADLAEPFELSEEGIAKGSVVVIDAEHPGKLKLSTRAYDRRVAGIVSGANGVNPGISLHQTSVLEKGENVSLSGRVYVLADAEGARLNRGIS